VVLSWQKTLLARLRALIRRGGAERPSVLVAGDLRLDLALSRERLIDAVWDDSFQGDSNIVDVYVARLRDKIDRPFGRSTVATVRGIGYRLEVGGGWRALA
jgi:two-component system OmpR family response regulator